VINWMTRKCKVENMVLKTVYDEIKDGLYIFNSIFFEHIYRESNRDENKLL
jgi:hypothetical protein